MDYEPKKIVAKTEIVVSEEVAVEEEAESYEKNRIVDDFEEEEEEDEDALEPPPDPLSQVDTPEVKHKHKIAIKMIDSDISIKLPSGLDFSVPFQSLINGECLEMDLGNENFIIEYLYEKIHIKYSGFDIHIPFVNK